MARKKPNVLITGTPGVGKSRIAGKVCKLTGLEHVNISQFAIDNKLILEHDSERSCEVIDDAKVVAKLKKKVEKGGLLVEYHSCEFFPDHWFDKVFVLRTDNSVLHSRLTGRGYNDTKVTENIECEIFQIVLEEAHDTFSEDKVMELENNNKVQLRNNIKAITDEVVSLRKSLLKDSND